MAITSFRACIARGVVTRFDMAYTPCGMRSISVLRLANFTERWARLFPTYARCLCSSGFGYDLVPIVSGRVTRSRTVINRRQCCFEMPIVYFRDLLRSRQIRRQNIAFNPHKYRLCCRLFKRLLSKYEPGPFDSKTGQF